MSRVSQDGDYCYINSWPCFIPLSTNDQNAEEQQMQQNSTSTSGTGSDRHYVTTRGRVVKKPTALKDFET